MKSSSWGILLVAAGSFTLGAWLFHTEMVKANPQETGGVHVYIAPLEMLTAKYSTSQNLPGGRIAGISCIPKPTEKLPDHVICYVATSLQ
jgi:hypothetical protein